VLCCVVVSVLCCVDELWEGVKRKRRWTKTPKFTSSSKQIRKLALIVTRLLLMIILQKTTICFRVISWRIFVWCFMEKINPVWFKPRTLLLRFRPKDSREFLSTGRVSLHCDHHLCDCTKIYLLTNPKYKSLRYPSCLIQDSVYLDLNSIWAGCLSGRWGD